MTLAMTRERRRVARNLFVVSLVSLLLTTTSHLIEGAATTAANVESQTTTTQSSSPVTTIKQEQPTTNISVTTTPEPSTARTPTEQEINEARKIIQEVASTISITNPHRLAMNKPLPSSMLVDFAPDSLESRVAEATNQMALNLMKLPSLREQFTTTSADPKLQRLKSTVVSPLSLQILLNMILLGTKDQSATQLELAKVLGYEDHELSLLTSNATLTNQTSSSNEQRLYRPHEGMHSVVESIMQATHLAVDQQRNLLNANQQQLEAHLSTTAHDEHALALTEQVNFTLANLMLTNKEMIETSAEYESDLRRYYNIKLEQFTRSRKMNASSQAAKGDAELPLHERVNNWVKNITHNQIVDLADEQTLADENLILILLNAAHFKGRWLHTFNSKLTQERPFYNHGQSDSNVDVKFMRQNGIFGYAEFTSNLDQRGNPDGGAGESSNENISPAAPTLELSKEENKRLELTSKLNCSALSLPFSLNDGQELSMVVLLPNRRDGLDEMLANLTPGALNEIYKSLTDQQVQVDLPKFSLESTHDVNSMLQQLGLKRIFGLAGDAELDRMFAPNSTLSAAAPKKVDKIVHKAKIAVDEQGAEAAAASMATVVLRSSIRFTTPTFTADHPFLYVIRHNRSNMPLFMGQLRAF